MAFETFDLGKVIATAEGIKSMRRDSLMDGLRERYLNAQIDNAVQSGRIAQNQDARAAVDQQAQVDARTARQRYLEAEFIERSPDPVAAAKQIAPELVQTFEGAHGQGSFDQLTPEVVKQLVGTAKARAASIAGIGPTTQYQRVNGPRGSLLQLDPTTNQLTQVVAPDNSQPIPSFANVQLEDGSIGAFNNRDGTVRNTGVKGNKPSADTKTSQTLRKEYEGLDAVKNYKAVVPMIESAKKAPDTGAGDLDVIYAVGKILDPGSVVREGELKLVIDAQSPVAKIVGKTRFALEKGGRIPPEQRQQLLQMLEGRTGALRDQYQRETDRFGGYAREANLDPSMVVGAPIIPATNTGGPVNRVRVDANGNLIK